jgi:hypothetical protein
LTFNARQRAAIKRWMGQAVPLKGVYFRSVEYRYMDPADVLFCERYPAAHMYL